MAESLMKNPIRVEKLNGVVKAWAPANIALIKYMGKTNLKNNTPANDSLSYTLNQFQTCVEISESKSVTEWQPLILNGFFAPELSEHGKKRFLLHAEKIAERFNFKSSFIIKSANNFPSDCGLASSASSFAALTAACMQLFTEEKVTSAQMVEMSQTGSGSSSRSFYSPWAIWRKDGSVQAVDSLPNEFLHAVVVVDQSVKKVSSSLAHQKVTSSYLFDGRAQRAEKRLQLLLKYLTNKNWRKSYETCWNEFQDMFALFETSEVPFGYMTDRSISVLNYIRENMWEKKGIGPIVTMDAGPNVHLLYPKEYVPLLIDERNYLNKNYKVIGDESM